MATSEAERWQEGKIGLATRVWSRECRVPQRQSKTIARPLAKRRTIYRTGLARNWSQTTIMNDYSKPTRYQFLQRRC